MGTEAPAPAEEAPPAEVAQEPTPTTPGGEGQNGEEEPDDEVDEEVDEEADVGPTGSGGIDPGSGAESGGLPSTGLELGAMAAIGLGLLMLGTALRPRQRQRG